MHILTAAPDSGGAAAFATVLLAAGMTYDEPKTRVLQNMKNVLAPLWPKAEAFYLAHGGLKRPWVMFHRFCDNPPPVTDDDHADYEKYDDAVVGMRSKTLIVKIVKDPNLTLAEQAVALGVMAWSKTGSQSSYLKLQKFAGAAGMPREALALMAVAESSQEKPARDTVKLLKKHGFDVKPNLRLSPAEAADFLAKNPQAAEQYKVMRKQMLTAFKEALVNYVREKGGAPQPVEDVRKHFQTRGYTVIQIPEGFKGLIGEDGTLFTSKGLKINGGKGASSVKMNPKYDANEDNGYVFTYMPSEMSEKDTYAFTFEWTQKQGEEKFKKARQLGDKLDTVLAKIHSDMKSKDAKRAVPATMLTLQYITAMRIGNPGGATKNKDGSTETTYGLSTLLVQHVKFKGPSLTITFHGKAGVAATYGIVPSDMVNRQLIANIKALMQNPDGTPKGQDDYVFADRTGRYNSDRVNKYLVAVSGITGITNHKIRHMRGTMLAESLIAKAPKRMDQKAAEDWFLESMTEVGRLLNHVKGVGTTMKVTPLTAIKNYIDPSVSLGFFKERGLRIPKFLATLTRTGTT
jgi:DNA topoisomerase IB